MAIKEWDLDTRKCFLIGDKISDIKAAESCCIDSYLYSEKKDNLLDIFKNKIAYLTS